MSREVSFQRVNSGVSSQSVNSGVGFDCDDDDVGIDSCVAENLTHKCEIGDRRLFAFCEAARLKVTVEQPIDISVDT